VSAHEQPVTPAPTMATSTRPEWRRFGSAGEASSSQYGLSIVSIVRC